MTLSRVAIDHIGKQRIVQLIRQLLRHLGLVELKLGRLVIHDFDELAKLAEFDPDYLHLKGGSGAGSQYGTQPLVRIRRDPTGGYGAVKATADA